jgi:predicted dehydrogenase
MEVFKWGVIGPGNIAQAFVADLPHAKSAIHTVHAVLSRHKNQSSNFSELFQVPHSLTDSDQFVEVGVDAVYIATPHAFHTEQVALCLQHHIPVLCEKPITINEKQLLYLLELSEQCNTFLLEGMWIRFLPSMEKLLSLLAVGVIGEIVAIEADVSFKAEYDPANRFYNPALGGGSLLDLGIYPVFLSTLLLGKPVKINAQSILSDTGVDTKCSAMFTYSGGQTASIESSLITSKDGVATIFGEKGLIRILHPWYEKPAGLEIESHDGTKIFHKCEWPGKGLYFEVDAVHDCIANRLRESPYYCHHFSLDIMQIMDEMRRQMRVVYPAYD